MMSLQKRWQLLNIKRLHFLTTQNDSYVWRGWMTEFTWWSESVQLLRKRNFLAIGIPTCGTGQLAPWAAPKLCYLQLTRQAEHRHSLLPSCLELSLEGERLEPFNRYKISPETKLLLEVPKPTLQINWTCDTVAGTYLLFTLRLLVGLGKCLR